MILKTFFIIVLRSLRPGVPSAGLRTCFAGDIPSFINAAMEEIRGNPAELPKVSGQNAAKSQVDPRTTWTCFLLDSMLPISLGVALH